MHVYVRCVVWQSSLVIGTKKNRSGRRQQRRPAGEVAKEFEVRELWHEIYTDVLRMLIIGQSDKVTFVSMGME